jgi:hypothetical protein
VGVGTQTGVGTLAATCGDVSVTDSLPVGTPVTKR